MKILLLEDNSTDAELTIRSLKKAWPQCSVEHVSSVKEAQEILEENPLFDIALLDMQLPDGNGLDILMEIRQKQLDIAVAMLTGSGDEEVAVAALKAGADDYTVKQPGYTTKVIHSVELALENHRQYNERISEAIHVLYIEHNAADVDFTQRHLTRYAPYIRLTDVPNAEKALELLPEAGVPPEEWNYQVVLMDYRLPGMNALEIIKEVRHERNLDIPILIVTGQGNE
ncbi:MAG: response regulator [Prolixibacteraceae bacterium]